MIGHTFGEALVVVVKTTIPYSQRLSVGIHHHQPVQFTTLKHNLPYVNHVDRYIAAHLHGRSIV